MTKQGKIGRVLFVCHGNICRSPMAECVFADILAKAGVPGVAVASAATHGEAEGCDISPRSLRQLAEAGVPARAHFAHRMTAREAAEADLIVGMDGANMANLRRMVAEAHRPKLRRLLDYTGGPRDVADPWFTGDYAKAFSDIREGCEAMAAALFGIGPQCAGSAAPGRPASDASRGARDSTSGPAPQPLRPPPPVRPTAG